MSSEDGASMWNWNFQNKSALCFSVYLFAYNHLITHLRLHFLEKTERKVHSQAHNSGDTIFPYILWRWTCVLPIVNILSRVKSISILGRCWHCCFHCPHVQLLLLTCLTSIPPYLPYVFLINRLSLTRKEKTERWIGNSQFQSEK